MKRPTSISEALRLARKRYADGGGADEIVNVAPPTPLGFFDRIFGKEQPVSYGRATPNQSWPSEADLATSRKYDQTYGNPVAPTVTEGAMIDRPSFAQAQKLYLSKSDTPNLQPVDQEQKDRLETAWLAANKTALGSLGFDPRHIASTPATKEATTVAGFYKPENDKIWYNEKYPSTIIHESLHRGIQELKDAGKLPDWLKSNMEETLVRGMMLKHLGNIEMGRGETGNKQIQYAQNLMEPRMSHGAVWATNHGKSFPNMLTELESLAARHLYEKQPRGPRAAGGRTEAVAAPSAPDASDAPSASATAPDVDAGISISQSNFSDNFGVAAALADAQADADAAAAAADAAAAAEGAIAEGGVDSGSYGDGISGGLGDGSIGGEGYGGSWGNSSSSDGSSSSSDGDGGGGGSEKRGGFVSQTIRAAKDKMVKKALDVSANRKSKAKLQKTKGRSVAEQAVVVASKLANRQRGRP